MRKKHLFWVLTDETGVIRAKNKKKKKKKKEKRREGKTRKEERDGERAGGRETFERRLL